MASRAAAVPYDEPAAIREDDDDDDDDVTFGGHDEFKLIPGGHTRLAGQTERGEKPLWQVDRKPESIINKLESDPDRALKLIPLSKKS